VTVRPPAPVDGDAARRAAEAELRHAEYHRDDPDLLDRIGNWLARRIAELFSGSVGGNVTLVFVVLLAAVVIFLVVRAGPPERIAGAREGDFDPLAPLPAHDHRRLAAEHEAAGRFPEALRDWLRATVRTIEERGILDPRPGRTGAATAREAGPLLPSVAGELAAVMERFDEVWFGGRPATGADAAAARHVAEAVVRAPIERRAPSGLAAPR
jgi:Domain of unknown function (DUF4129)